MGKTDKIVYHGVINRDEVHNLYARSRVGICVLKKYQELL